MPKILSPAFPRRRSVSVARYALLAVLIILGVYTFKRSSGHVYSQGGSSLRTTSGSGLTPNGKPLEGTSAERPQRPQPIPDKETASLVTAEAGSDPAGKPAAGDSGSAKKPLKAPTSKGKKPAGREQHIFVDGNFGADGTHPMDTLIYEGQYNFYQLTQKETRTLEEAAQAYRTRRGRHPPPGFDKWYEFAQARNAVIVEDFWDQIYDDLEPFWGMDPAIIRKESWDFEMVISIRDGVASTSSDWFWTVIWLDMIKTMEHVLPDMDLALNAMDEPRLVVPWEDVNDYMQRASKTKKLAKAKSVSSTFQKLPPPGKGDTHVTTRDKGWEKTSPYWKIVQRGCPPDSPARTAPLEPGFAKPPVIDMVNTIDHTYRGFIANYTKSTQVCHQPDLQGLEGVFIAPLSTSATKTLFPMFGGSKLHVNNEILLPAPMYWNEEERFTGGDDHGVEWASKVDKAIWRGVATGGKNSPDNWRRFQRHRFVAMNNATKIELAETREAPPENFALPDPKYGLRAQKDGRFAEWVDYWSDVAFVDLMCDPPEEEGTCSYTSPHYSVAMGLRMSEQFDYKYLPDIDGNSFSGRYLGFLRSTSLPLKATLWREWHDSRLVPWKHFVPMDSRFGDYYGIMQYFLGYNGQGGHDDAARQIAVDGKEWAERVLRKEDMQIYTLRLLLEYARVLDDGREKMGWVDDALANPDLERAWEQGQ